MIRIDAAGVASARLSDAWRECVGTGRTGEVLRSDYRDSLRVLQREIGFRYTRAHGIFHDDMGVFRRYDTGGYRGVQHGFTNVDLVVDTWLEHSIAPFIELGFMPSELASGDQTVFWWQGNVTPPRDEREWKDLVKGLLRHLIDRYGLETVRTWPIEVWNEPNLSVFWKDADEAAYHRLYEISAHAVKEVDSELQVGGPAICPGHDWWIPNFVEAVEAKDIPCDFISKHAYTSHPAREVPFGCYQRLRSPQDLLDQFATPRQLLAGTGLADVPIHITEFSTSYRPDNPIHDTAFQAAYLAPVLVRGGELVDSFSYWVLSDVFEEMGVPVSILHGGFGLLGFRQLRKPAFHLFTFMAKLGSEILFLGEDHVVTRRPDGSLAVLLWQPVDGAALRDTGHRVQLGLSGLPERVAVVQRHVDAERGNVRRTWQDLGSPPAPSSQQMDLLHAGSEPTVVTSAEFPREGNLDLTVNLGVHGVCLLEVLAAPDCSFPWSDDALLLGENAGDGDVGAEVIA